MTRISITPPILIRIEEFVGLLHLLVCPGCAKFTKKSSTIDKKKDGSHYSVHFRKQLLSGQRSCVSFIDD